MGGGDAIGISSRGFPCVPTFGYTSVELRVKLPPPPPGFSSGLMTTIVCRVLSPIIAPIVARPGELLVIRPAAEDSLVVTNAAGEREIRRAAIPPGRLYGDLLHLMLDEAIRPLTSVDERLLLRAS